MSTLAAPVLPDEVHSQQQHLSYLSLKEFYVYQRTVSGHARQVKLLAQAVAHQLQQTEEEVYLLGLAALMHDLGKIAIPPALLNKPGPLTEQEWIVMRLHPVIGASLLEKAGGTWSSVAPAVLAHHERWDGDGYPYRLAGEEIPLHARILAVADSYAAMTELRPYRTAISPAEARTEIRRGIGRAYDPRVAEAFLALCSRHDQGASVHLSSIFAADEQHIYI
ncbi:HD-GYP domain-containing protein [Dictyobacter aurantiacus]|uniref:HD-GYP domain-containing protein n=1 Tax=Dictyobacter aurantiacus TaxID=1936993 RepID=A0A401ZLW0_9CHLR|nr:HD-GYP domain-containing protein [Dictyobacter aurantiacus]GCE07843.1 hypothetical protein KDAU_51720 [Dictyobacter aurantiacus]